MIISSTIFQNNFGKYLDLCERENIVVTKNGKKRAVLIYYPHSEKGYEAGEPASSYGTSPRPEGWVGYREFVELTRKSEQQYELIDGVIYLMGSPGFTHQRILGRLYITFNDFFQDRNDCGPFLSPFDVKLMRSSIRQRRELGQDDINVVQPDLLVLCDYQRFIDEDDRYGGIPSLAAEILSPSTRSRDMVKKMDLFMDSGIREYWLIDPEKKSIGVYSFKEYELASDDIFFAGQTAVSQIFPGLEAELDAVFGG